MTETNDRGYGYTSVSCNIRVIRPNAFPTRVYSCVHTTWIEDNFDSRQFWRDFQSAFHNSQTTVKVDFTGIQVSEATTPTRFGVIYNAEITRLLKRAPQSSAVEERAELWAKSMHRRRMGILTARSTWSGERICRIFVHDWSCHTKGKEVRGISRVSILRVHQIENFATDTQTSPCFRAGLWPILRSGKLIDPVADVHCLASDLAEDSCEKVVSTWRPWRWLFFLPRHLSTEGSSCLKAGSGELRAFVITTPLDLPIWFTQSQSVTTHFQSNKNNEIAIDTLLQVSFPRLSVSTAWQWYLCLFSWYLAKWFRVQCLVLRRAVCPVCLPHGANSFTHHCVNISSYMWTTFQQTNRSLHRSTFTKMRQWCYDDQCRRKYEQCCKVSKISYTCGILVFALGHSGKYADLTQKPLKPWSLRVWHGLHWDTLCHSLRSPCSLWIWAPGMKFRS